MPPSEQAATPRDVLRGDVLGGDTLRDKERAENFPVALRLLPRTVRRHLAAVYDVARTVDDLGDEAAGDRLALLDAFAADLAVIWQGGTPSEPVLARLAGTVRACDLPAEPFERLVEANRRDQVVTRYPRYEDLLAYCTLSAEPVGRIVLGIFGAGTPERVARSDRICTALQLVEHWQDVAEDRRAGRIYLPLEDLARFGVAETDLDLPSATPAFRELMTFQTDRAARLMDSGAPLVRDLRGWARVAVSGYLAGGRAAVDALRRTGGDVLGRSATVRKRRVLWHALPLLVGRAV